MPPTSIDGVDITGATIDGTEVTEITADGQVVFSATDFDPNATELVLGNYTRGVTLQRIDKDNNLIAEYDGSEDATSIDIGPNGNNVFWRSDGDDGIYKSDLSTLTIQTSNTSNTVHALRTHPNGDIYTMAESGDINRFDTDLNLVDSGNITLNPDSDKYINPCIGPNDNFLVPGDAKVKAVDPSTLSVNQTMTLDGTDSRLGVETFADGNIYISADDDGELYQYDSNYNRLNKNTNVSSSDRVGSMFMFPNDLSTMWYSVGSETYIIDPSNLSITNTNTTTNSNPHDGWGIQDLFFTGGFNGNDNLYRYDKNLNLTEFSTQRTQQTVSICSTYARHNIRG